MQTERGVGTDDEVPRFGTLRQGGWKAERCLPGATHTSTRPLRFSPLSPLPRARMRYSNEPRRTNPLSESDSHGERQASVS